MRYYASFSSGDLVQPTPAPARKAARVSRKAAVPVETDIQREILADLRAQPYVAQCDRFNSGRFGDRGQYKFSTADGHSDIAGHRTEGRAFFVEVKRTEDDVLLYSQARFLIERYSFAFVGVARSVADARVIVNGEYSFDMLLAEVKRVRPEYLSKKSRILVLDPQELVDKLEEMRAVVKEEGKS